MIDDLSSFFDLSKRADLVNRLNNKRVEQSLPAEMELALIWILKDLARLEIEPTWWADGKKPDAYVEGLIPKTPAVVEITTVADNSMSGEPEMAHCARELLNIANEARKGSGDYLYFRFAETKERNRQMNIRGIAAPKNYKPSEQTKSLLGHWIASEKLASNKLTIEDAGLSVVVEHCEHKQTRYHNVRTSRPPRANSETKNPIYNTLNEKLSQVEGAPSGTWRVIFLAEAGSGVLSELKENDRNYRVEQYITAQNIINRFLRDKYGRVDAVVAFVPVKQFQSGFLGQHWYDRKWSVTVFGEDNLTNQLLLKGINKQIVKLPAPQLNGYNARSLTQQNALKHNSRGRYLPTTASFKDHKLTYKMSCRAFQDFLSGRTDEKSFRHLFGDRADESNIKMFLSRGYTIRSASFEEGGVDQDDDYIILEFAQDAAASKFK